jgi:hypothetical protein
MTAGQLTQYKLGKGYPEAHADMICDTGSLGQAVSTAAGMAVGDSPPIHFTLNPLYCGICFALKPTLRWNLFHSETHSTTPLLRFESNQRQTKNSINAANSAI